MLLILWRCDSKPSPQKSLKGSWFHKNRRKFKNIHDSSIYLLSNCYTFNGSCNPYWELVCSKNSIHDKVYFKRIDVLLYSFDCLFLWINLYPNFCSFVLCCSFNFVWLKELGTRNKIVKCFLRDSFEIQIKLQITFKCD